MAVLVNILKAGVLCIGLGAAFTTVRVLQKRSEEEDLKNSRLKIPRVLESMAPIRDALMLFSEHKQANLYILGRVGRRCASLLEAYMKVSAAKSDTVRPSIIALGSRYTASIKKYLRQFYAESDIPLMEIERQFIPVNRELQHAHESLMLAVECLSESIELAVREKLESGVAERV